MSVVKRPGARTASRQVQQYGRGSLSAGHRQTVCLLPAMRHRHVRAGHRSTWSDLALPVQRPSGEDVLYALQREEQRSSSPSDHVVGGASLIFQRYYEKWVITLRQNVRVDRSSDTMPTRCTCGLSCKTRRWGGTRDDGKRTTFGPNRYGQMAAEWLTWESERTGRAIRHQINGREKRIGKVQVDGWCSETNTAYQFHGCFYHGHPCTRQEVNAVNGKPNCSPRPERTPSTYVTLSRSSRCGNAERDEKRSGREKVSGCCISATMTSTSTMRGQPRLQDQHRQCHLICKEVHPESDRADGTYQGSRIEHGEVSDAIHRLQGVLHSRGRSVAHAR